jgi:hypothetical protein
MRWLGAAAFATSAFIAISPAPAEWRAYEARHFTIYSEGGEARATELATRLQKYDKLMRMATGIADDNPSKVRIFEVPSTDEIEKALGLSGTGIAGFYSSNTFGPFLVTPRRTGDSGRYFTPHVVLQHEYAHHFMLQYFPATYPSWYVEGFAELIGSSTLEKDGRIMYGAPARQRGDQLVNYWVPLQEVFASDEAVRDLDPYGQGWAMTQYLTMDPVRSKQLRTYLQLLNAGKSNREAASTAFGDLAKLNSDIRLHLQRGSWIVRPVTPEIAKPVLTGSRALSPAEVALLPEMIAFDDDPLDVIRKAGERAREAQRRQSRYAKVREIVARFPSDPFAIAFLADVAAVNGDKAEVDSATRRLLAIQPDNVRGLVRRSLLLAEQARTLAPAERKSRTAEARAMAVRANRIDADDPLPLMAFYQSFNLAGETPTGNAVTGLETALVALPDDDAIRLLLVEEYARQKRFPAAMATLAPLANSPHDSPQRENARGRMAQLKAEAGSSKAAPAAAS